MTAIPSFPFFRTDVSLNSRICSNFPEDTNEFSACLILASLSPNTTLPLIVLQSLISSRNFCKSASWLSFCVMPIFSSISLTSPSTYTVLHGMDLILRYRLSVWPDSYSSRTSFSCLSKKFSTAGWTVMSGLAIRTDSPIWSALACTASQPLSSGTVSILNFSYLNMASSDFPLANSSSDSHFP